MRDFRRFGDSDSTLFGKLKSDGFIQDAIDDGGRWTRDMHERTELLEMFQYRGQRHIVARDEHVMLAAGDQFTYRFGEGLWRAIGIGYTHEVADRPRVGGRFVS